MPKVTVISWPEETRNIAASVVKSLNGGQAATWKNKLGAFVLPLLHRDNMVVSVMAFLLARVFIAGEITSVGVAFFAAVAQAVRKRAVAAGLWAVIGVASGGFYADACMYACAILLYLSWERGITRAQRKMSATSLFMFAAVLCGNLSILLFRQITLYNAILAFFNAGICMILSLVFSYGIPLILKENHRRVSGENIACLLVMAAGIVSGIGQWSLAGYGLKAVLGSLVIMVLACAGGPGLGAAAGISIGLVTGLSEENTLLSLGIYAVAGMLAGTFRSLGKFGVMLGFLFGNLLIMLHFGENGMNISLLGECTAAAILFAVMPERRIISWYERITGGAKITVHSGISTQEAIGKVRNISDIFDNMAITFKQVALKTEEKIKEDDWASTLRMVGERVCESCEKRPVCWEDNFYRTYQAILEMVGYAEAGTLQKRACSNTLKEHCGRYNEIIDCMLFVADKNRSQRFWQKKIAEQKQAAIEQMAATGKIIGNLAYELAKEQPVNRELGITLRERSALLGCPLTAVEVVGDAAATTIEVRKSPCNGNRECKNTILPLAANLINEKLNLQATCGQGPLKKICRIRMQVAKTFTVEWGVACKAKDGQQISGDLCKVISLRRGKVAVLLSDGMGSGSMAAGESKKLIHLLERLLTAGFDTDVAVKTVNSMLLLTGKEESFATLDMAVIDTYTGETELLKVAAAPSFIKRVREVRIIHTSSLPAGIMQQVEIEPLHALLVNGDILVMISDGIADIIGKGVEKDCWLTNFLRRSNEDNPQRLAEKVLSQALSLAGKAADDMTVVAVLLRNDE
jgi:stage II sporulation protein E